MTKVDTMLKKNKTHLVFLKWPTVFPVPTPVVSVFTFPSYKVIFHQEVKIPRPPPPYSHSSEYRNKCRIFWIFDPLHNDSGLRLVILMIQAWCLVSGNLEFQAKTCLLLCVS